MAHKSPEQWSAAYKRRVERALAQGKTKQQARGHKPREHVIRREWAISLGVLTSGERETIKHFVREQERRGIALPYEVEDASELIELMNDSPRVIQNRLMGGIAFAADMRRQWKNRRRTGFAGIGKYGMERAALYYQMSEYNFYYH